jgi:hypothetical protein
MALAFKVVPIAVPNPTVAIETVLPEMLVPEINVENTLVENFAVVPLNVRAVAIVPENAFEFTVIPETVVAFRVVPVAVPNPSVPIDTFVPDKLFANTKLNGAFVVPTEPLPEITGITEPPEAVRYVNPE